MGVHYLVVGGDARCGSPWGPASRALRDVSCSDCRRLRLEDLGNPSAEDLLRLELREWRREHPYWTERGQLGAFSPHELWARAGGRIADDGTVPPFDRELYFRLMDIAGYLRRDQQGS